MRIIDKETGIDFDLPSDAEKISILETHPMLTEQGSISLTFSIKSSDKNNRVLKFPYRFDRKDKYLFKRQVIIIQGSFQIEASMVVTSAKKNANITVTFLLNEGEINNRIKDGTMEDVFSGEKYKKDIFSGTHEQKVASWADYCDKVMCGDIREDFRIFPICTNKTLKATDYLNHVAVRNDGGGWNESIRTADDGKRYYRLTGLQAFTGTVDDVPISFPVGYGISPFLKLNYILKTIFSHFGFELEESLFDTDPDLKKIVLLNNTVDTLLSGILNYAQLVPNCTVSEFLNTVKTKFGCGFIVDKDNVHVRIVFWDDILENYGENRSEKINTYPTISYEKYKTVKLEQEHNIGTSDIYWITNTFETYQKLLETYPEIIIVKTISDARSMGEGFYFVCDELLFYQKNTQGIIIPVGMDLYDYYESNEELEYLEFSSKSEAIPIIKWYMAFRYGGIERYPPDILMPYIDKIRQLNSTIQYNDDDEKSNDEKKISKDCPILFCYAHGRAEYEYIIMGDGEEVSLNTDLCFFGTTYAYNNLGESIGSLDLVYGGERGLYKRFWQKLDHILKTSFQPVKTSLNLNPVEIMKYDKTKLDMIDGQPLLMENMKYEISGQGVKMVEINYRTVKKYEENE